MKKSKKVFSLLDVSIIVLITSFVMCFLGATLVYKHLGGVNFSLLGEDTDLQEFIAAYNNLLDNYYDSLDKSELIEGAIEGMYSVSGDPYTTYLDESSSESLTDSLSGSYEGIGILMSKNDDGYLLVENVFDASPAYKAGIKVGDIITKVDGEDISEKETTYISDKIKSDKECKLTINRDSIELEFNVSTSTIMVPVVSSQLIESGNKKIGYIRLTLFNDTADVQFSNHLNKLESSGIDSLIIDLRDNSGGYLQVASNIAESFLEKGKVIYSLESKDSSSTTKDQTSEKRSYPVDVILNGNSASASEILAAALKYSYGATLVGNTSYGKGKVQERATLSSGTSIKYTTALWLTPNGDCIDEVGLTPDVEIDLNYDTYDETDISTDTQIMAAVNNLVG